MFSSLTSALGVDLTWVLGCPVNRCGVGVGAVPRRFLVLTFIIDVYFVGGFPHGFKQVDFL